MAGPSPGALWPAVSLQTLSWNIASCSPWLQSDLEIDGLLACLHRGLRPLPGRVSLRAAETRFSRGGHLCPTGSRPGCLQSMSCPRRHSGCSRWAGPARILVSNALGHGPLPGTASPRCWDIPCPGDSLCLLTHCSPHLLSWSSGVRLCRHLPGTPREPGHICVVWKLSELQGLRQSCETRPFICSTSEASGSEPGF